MGVQQTIDIENAQIYTMNMKMKEKILQGIIFKVQKKGYVFRTIAGLLSGLLVFGGITHLLNLMYVKDDADTWDRILWHDFYEEQGKIDNIYIGSSHVFYNIKPQILDRLNGENNFNLSSPTQPLNTSYYLLKEAERTNRLSHVYLEMYYGCVIDDTKLQQYTRQWMHIDYMKPSLNRVAYRMAVGEPDQYINSVFPFTRYRVYLGDWDQIKETLEWKAQEEYKNYCLEKEYMEGTGQKINGRETYGKQGYRKSTRTYNDRRKYYNQNVILTDYTMGNKNEAYCIHIIEYCKEKEIPITLFISPICNLQLISTVDYDDYTSAIRALAEQQGVPFYDFNLVKEEYLPIQDGKYFSDSHHLNQDGAEKFTPFFYQIVSGAEVDNEIYFYNSYEEKLREVAPSVYGVYEELPEEESRNRTLRIASNRGSEMEYRIVLQPDGKKRRRIQDFQENMTFRVPHDEHGICTIAARVKENPVDMRTMSIRY